MVGVPQRPRKTRHTLDTAGLGLGDEEGGNTSSDHEGPEGLEDLRGIRSVSPARS